MNSKTKNIIHWSLAAVVFFIFISGGIVKLSGSLDATEMANSLGISMSSFKMLGMVELIAGLLFIMPRTGILGSLLLIAYMGGAISAHLLTGTSILFPSIIQAFVWIVAYIRFPELRQRILEGLNWKTQLK